MANINAHDLGLLPEGVIRLKSVGQPVPNAGNAWSFQLDEHFMFVVNENKHSIRLPAHYIEGAPQPLPGQFVMLVFDSTPFCLFTAEGGYVLGWDVDEARCIISKINERVWAAVRERERNNGDCPVG